MYEDHSANWLKILENSILDALSEDYCQSFQKSLHCGWDKNLDMQFVSKMKP